GIDGGYEFGELDEARAKVQEALAQNEVDEGSESPIRFDLSDDFRKAALDRFDLDEVSSEQAT
ncbi:MAG: hypothetical protein ACREP9_23720, partial [Candidatus Dormibacteraceae bacterium]